MGETKLYLSVSFVSRSHFRVASCIFEQPPQFKPSSSSLSTCQKKIIFHLMSESHETASHTYVMSVVLCSFQPQHNTYFYKRNKTSCPSLEKKKEKPVKSTIQCIFFLCSLFSVFFFLKGFFSIFPTFYKWNYLHNYG